MIRIQQENFFIDALIEQIKLQAGNNVGAICTFIGQVREVDEPGQPKLTALKLEHYPEMTEKSLEALSNDALSKFNLSAVTIVHRVGKLLTGENIVFVGTSSEHRKSAFDGCEFIMDYLKNEAPFWKKEFRDDGTEKWIDQKQSDRDATKKWL